jgi:DNA polymerase
MSSASAHALRIARQHLETTRLLGVDFVPIAGESNPSLAAPTSAPVSVNAHITEVKPHPRAEDAAPGSKAHRLLALRTRYEAEAKVPKLIKGWNRIVFGDGSPDARLMFIGEAPGADEDAQGIPFVGRAGQKLNEMIGAMGLTRESVYIANILKVRPPDNRTPTPEEAQLDGPYLIEQIEIIAPEVIVTLGKPAAHFILNSTDSMSNLRGRWAEFRGIPVMPTFHPAYLLRAYTPENRKKVWSDLQEAMHRLALPGS